MRLQLSVVTWPWLRFITDLSYRMISLFLHLKASSLFFLVVQFFVGRGRVVALPTVPSYLQQQYEQTHLFGFILCVFLLISDWTQCDHACGRRLHNVTSCWFINQARKKRQVSEEGKHWKVSRHSEHDVSWPALFLYLWMHWMHHGGRMGTSSLLSQCLLKSSQQIRLQSFACEPR